MKLRGRDGATRRLHDCATERMGEMGEWSKWRMKNGE